MQDDLIALAERCEAAEGPDREMMYEAFDACLSRTAPSRPGTVTWTREWLRFQKLLGAEAWLDAAMTLVPEGANTSLSMQDRHSNRWRWELRHGFGVRTSTWADTAALALCATALRARAAMGGGDD